jgi:hypothetical protein
MKANELRIGNYVNEDVLGDAPISEITESTVGLSVNHMDINRVESIVTYIIAIHNIKSIPLTHEILEKCGFKKYSHNPGYAIDSDSMSEKCDEYNLGKLSIMDWGDGFVLSNSFSFSLRVELKHLHQLQNLVHSITGEELEVKL